MSASKTTAQRQPLPFQQENVATNQTGIPVPVVGGKRLVAGRWITPAMDKVAQEAKTGKKG